MRFLFQVIRFMPIWTVLLGLILIEAGVVFRRRGHKNQFFVCLTLGLFTLLLCVLFFVFRWDATLYPWIRGLW